MHTYNIWPNNLFKIINGDLVSLETVGNGYLTLFTLKLGAPIFGFDGDLEVVLAQTLHYFPAISGITHFSLIR